MNKLIVIYYYPLPLECPDEVDEIRAKVGLIPMSIYLSQWQIDWKADKYSGT